MIAPSCFMLGPNGDVGRVKTYQREAFLTYGVRKTYLVKREVILFLFFTNMKDRPDYKQKSSTIQKTKQTNRTTIL